MLAYPSSPTALWMGAVLFGTGMAASFPSGLTLMEDYIEVCV
jgi:hypothetical protein